MRDYLPLSRPVTLRTVALMAREINYADSIKPLKIKLIIDYVFHNLNVSISWINSNTRKREVVMARYISMYFSINKLYKGLFP